MERRKSLTDWKRNNKVAVRNFTVSADKHDVVKIMLVRMLRREHRDNTKCPIYTEYDLEGSENFPDIQMKLDKDIYVWEIQKVVSPAWQKEIIKKYEHVNLIIVPLHRISNDLEIMREQLKEFLI